MNFRTLLGITLIMVGIFYQGGDDVPVVPTPEPEVKIERPEEDIVAMVEALPTISDKSDSNKLAATFFAMYEKMPETELSTNLEVQYFLDFVGRATNGEELLENGVAKYPEFSPIAAKLISDVIGPQEDTSPLTSEEKKRLARLFYGFAWKLYEPDEDDVFEEYKSKAIKAISEYNNDEPEPQPDDNTKCPCEGKGYIIHGDGHRSNCPCIESGGKCEHDPKCGSKR